MNGTSARKIEIFAPFSAALDLTKLILFQPFDLGKWCVIGFAAFLSHLAGGGGGSSFNFRSPMGHNDWQWNVRSTTHDAFQSASGLPGWAIPLGIFVGLIFLAILIVCLWVGSRGKFIFVDCVVRNRGRITEPWHEFRHEGNSFFIYSLVVGFASLCVIVLLCLPIWLPLAMHGDVPSGAAFIISIAGVALILVVLGMALALISSFMVPIMYRRRCGAAAAFSAALGLVTSHLGPVILYVLFIIVLWIAFSLLACLTTCLTCCITAIPYVGTVILLPFYVFFISYLLLFVRQFGEEYDVWANVVPLEPAAPATTLPPPPPIKPPSPPAAPPPQI
ncbi:MAG: hypothetical protein M3Y86_02945 [Verrucomicrobiota bacterium]|nr:hypothetical protein [Verrucomicrobiota bacterium]